MFQILNENDVTGLLEAGMECELLSTCSSFPFEAVMSSPGNVPYLITKEDQSISIAKSSISDKCRRQLYLIISSSC